MRKLLILFQGDSITDAGRDYRNYHDMGRGYPKYASEIIKENNPDMEIEFINFGIGGNRTSQLFDRLYNDTIAFQPDIISILVGINDIWHRYMPDRYIATTDAQIETNYRSILERIRRETSAKIVMMSPYLLDCEDKEEVRADLARLLPVIHKLAGEYADVFIPLDEHFEKALKSAPTPMYYSSDGVHPNERGASFIAELYAKALQPLIEKF